MGSIEPSSGVMAVSAVFEPNVQHNIPLTVSPRYVHGVMYFYFLIIYVPLSIFLYSDCSLLQVLQKVVFKKDSTHDCQVCQIVLYVFNNLSISHFSQQYINVKTDSQRLLIM